MITKVDENKALQPQKDAGLTKPQDKNLTSLKAAPELIEGRAGQRTGHGGHGGHAHQGPRIEGGAPKAHQQDGRLLQYEVDMSTG